MAVDVAADREVVERQLRVLHREVDALRAAGRTRGAEAGQRSEGGVRARLVAPDITADADRRAIRELLVTEAGRLQEAFAAALEQRQLRALPVALRAAAPVRRAGDHDAPALGQRGSLDDRVPAEGQRGALVDDDLDVGDLPGVGTGGELARAHALGQVTEERALAAAPAAEEGWASAQRTAARRLEQRDAHAELEQQPAGEAGGGRIGDQPGAEAVEWKHGRPFVVSHRDDAMGSPLLRGRRRGRRRSSRPRAAPPRCPRRAWERGRARPSVFQRVRRSVRPRAVGRSADVRGRS